MSLIIFAQEAEKRAKDLIKELEENKKRTVFYFQRLSLLRKNDYEQSRLYEKSLIDLTHTYNQVPCLQKEHIAVLSSMFKQYREKLKKVSLLAFLNNRDYNPELASYLHYIRFIEICIENNYFPNLVNSFYTDPIAVDALYKNVFYRQLSETILLNIKERPDYSDSLFQLVHLSSHCLETFFKEEQEETESLIPTLSALSLKMQEYNKRLPEYYQQEKTCLNPSIKSEWEEIVWKSLNDTIEKPSSLNLKKADL